MQKVNLVHMCLFFEYKHKKYVYGLTYSMLTSNYLVKYRPDVLIIPSMAFVQNMFMHAGLDDLFDKVLHTSKNESSASKRKAKTNQQTEQKQEIGNVSVLDKIVKKLKLAACDEKALKYQYNNEIITSLQESGHLLPLKQHELEEVRLIDMLVELVKDRSKISQEFVSISNKHDMEGVNKNKGNKGGDRIQLINWINNPLHELRILVTETGTTTYIIQCNNLLVVDPSEEYLPYLQYNTIISTASANSLLHSKQKQMQQQKQQEKHQNRDQTVIPCLLQMLHTVIVTKLSSVASVLALMIVEGFQSVRVLVISEELEMGIIDKAHRYLHMPEEIVRSRLLIRNISHMHASNNQHTQHKLYKYPIFSHHLNPYSLQCSSVLSCIYHPLSVHSPQVLELQFGSSIDVAGNKKILFYAAPTFMTSQTYPQVEVTHMHMPANLQSKHVQFVVMYRIGEQLGKQLKALPQQLRKKIVLNRNQHKYNHKYYYTFQKHKIQSCTVTDTQYITLINSNKMQKNTELMIGTNIKPKQTRQKQLDTSQSLYSTETIEIGCKIYEMGDQAELETIGHAIQVLDGYVQVYYHDHEHGRQGMDIVGRGSRVIDNSYRVVALKYTQVKMVLSSNYQIMTQYSRLQSLSNLKQQHANNNINSLLITSINPANNACDNSLPHLDASSTVTVQPKYIISSLLNIEHLHGIEDNTLIAELSLQQKQLLNSICHPITHQVGFKTNNYNENIYFISKGGMKWDNSDRVAGNECYIGDLLSFYQKRQNQLYQFDNYIEVIKDTWAVYINIEEFHKYFILQNPHLLYKIFHKGKIFN